MARNGSGVYSLPAGYEAVTGETILATQHNTPLEDLAADANAARPVVAGGTGANTAAAARTALGLAIGTNVQAYSPGLSGVGVKGADIASASTVDLSTATGDYVDITGTTTITSFGTVAAGKEFTLQFDGIVTITYNGTSMILKNGLDLTTAAGDIAVFRSEGSGNWRLMNYRRANAIVFSANSPAETAATAELATYGTSVLNSGGHFNATNGRFTAPTAGLYRFNFSVLGKTGGATAEAALYKNGSSLGVIASAPAPAGARGFSSQYGVIALAKADYVSVFMTVSSNLSPSSYTSFSGEIIE